MKYGESRREITIYIFVPIDSHIYTHSPQARLGLAVFFTFSFFENKSQFNSILSHSTQSTRMNTTLHYNVVVGIRYL